MRSLYIAVIASVAAGVLANPCKADEPAALPDFDGVFVAQTPAGIVALERETANTQVRGNILAMGFGLGKSQAVMVLPGEHSTSRFGAGQHVSFIVRVESQNRDPSTFLEFYRVHPHQGQRELITATASNLTGQQQNGVAQSDLMTVHVKKKGEHYLEFTPGDPLQPGEYIIGTTDERTFFSFGVD
jgi:hypothetical protein